MRRASGIATGILTLALATSCQITTAPGTGGKGPRPAASARATTPPASLASPAGTNTALPPAPATYFGRVLSPDGKPAGDILVRGFLLSDQGTGLVSNNSGSVVANNGGGLLSDQGTGYVLAQATVPSALQTRTAADGTFKLADPQGRPLNLEAVASDELKAFKRGVTATAAGIDLTLAPTGSITGLVKAAGVSDLIGVDVFVPGTGYVAKTDAAGRFTIPNVPVGTFDLYAAKPGLGKASATAVPVESKQATSVADLVLALERPMLSAVEPPAAGPGSTVTLKGQNFAAADGQVFQVTLAGAVIANPDRVAGDTIRIKVPAGAKSGDLVGGVGGVQGNAVPFVVFAALETGVPVRDLAAGERVVLDLKARDGDDKLHDDPPVTWSATGTALKVDADGQVTAEAPGPGEVTAASGDTRLTLAFAVHAAPDIIVSLAGAPEEGNTDGPGGYARFRSPAGLSFLDPKTLVCVDGGNHNVRRIDLTDPLRPVVSHFAGGPGREKDRPADADPVGGFQDGPARDARFAGPASGVADGLGGYLVADQNNHRIRRVAADGTVSTVAGSGVKGVADGPVAAATLTSPSNLALGPDGTLYFTQHYQHAVRALKDGVVSTLAGSNTVAGAVDGPGAAARFGKPGALLLDGQGGLLVADRDNHRIRRIDLADPAHPVTTFAGSTQGLADGVGLAAKFDTIGAMARAPNGTIYVADYRGWDDGYGTRLRKITPEGAVSTLEGDGGSGRRDGPLGTAKFGVAGSFLITPEGAHMYFIDRAREGEGAVLRRWTLP